MAALVRPEAEFLRQNQKLLNDTLPRCDVALFLCYRRWLATDHCAASSIAAALTRENIQYSVSSEENFAELTERPGIIPAPYLARAKWVALETRDALSSDELTLLLRESYDMVVAKLPMKTREALASGKLTAQRKSFKMPATKTHSQKSLHKKKKPSR